MDETSRLRELFAEACRDVERAEAAFGRAEVALQEATGRREALGLALRLMGETADRSTRPASKGRSDRPNVADPTLEFLNSRPDDIFEAPAIADAIKVANVNSLRSALLRLSQDGKIEKVGHGKYRAKRPEVPPANGALATANATFGFVPGTVKPFSFPVTPAGVQVKASRE